MILLDTCALLWQSFDPDKLSQKSQKAIKTSQELIISSISIWEIGIKVKNGKLSIPISLENYLELLKQVNGVKFIPVDEEIWIQSLNLSWEHKDPADRVIVATAKRLGISIITSDNNIKEFYKKIIW